MILKSGNSLSEKITLTMVESTIAENRKFFANAH